MQDRAILLIDGILECYTYTPPSRLYGQNDPQLSAAKKKKKKGSDGLEFDVGGDLVKRVFSNGDTHIAAVTASFVMYMFKYSAKTSQFSKICALQLNPCCDIAIGSESLFVLEREPNSPISCVREIVLNALPAPGSFETVIALNESTIAHIPAHKNRIGGILTGYNDPSYIGEDANGAMKRFKPNGNASLGYVSSVFELCRLYNCRTDPVCVYIGRTTSTTMVLSKMGLLRRHSLSC